MSLALVPGSFDPVTNGHLDIIRRTSSLFERVCVVVATNSRKAPLFTVEERLDMLSEVCAPYANVTVDVCEGLLVHFAARCGAQVIVKGLRFVSDFENELQMARLNLTQNSAVETVFLPTGVEFSALSSSIVKEIARLGGAVEGLVPDSVQRHLRKKYAQP